jgi:hypothetical protein
MAAPLARGAGGGADVCGFQPSTAGHNSWHNARLHVAAQGEMDVVVDLVTNLEHGRHIDFKILQHQQQQPSAPAGRPAGMQG